MEHIRRYGLIAAVAAIALLVPTRAASQTEPQVIEVVVSLTDLAPPTVNVSVPEQAAPTIIIPDQPAPVVNVEVPAATPPTVIVEPAATPAPQVVYQDREVERIVEGPACVDPNRLTHFDLVNWLVVGHPGAEWSLNGSSYEGLTWLSASPKPTLHDIIDAYLAEVTKDC